MTLWSTVPSPHTRVYSALAGATTASELLSFLMKVSGVQTEPGGSVTYPSPPPCSCSREVTPSQDTPPVQ